MTRNELIKNHLAALGWTWHERTNTRPERVDLVIDAMHDETQSIIANGILHYRSVRQACLISRWFSITSNRNSLFLTKKQSFDFKSHAGKL